MDDQPPAGSTGIIPTTGEARPTDHPGVDGSAYMCRLRGVKMTGPLERVLRAFLDDPAALRYGYDLMKAASLQSGTLYPLLARLEQQKLVTSAWETPQQDGQRPRTYYRLTAKGAEVARLELAQISAGRRRSLARPARPAPGSLG
jgi:DNA-binding PadR family transcriptional regulator